MPRCDHCKRKNHLLLNCKWCLLDCCTKCVSFEVHECKGLDAMKEHNLKKLEEELHKNKTESVKLIKI